MQKCLKEKTDKFEHERFGGSCPTCGQEFLKEKLDQYREFLSIVAKDVICDGPNCPFCEGDQEHPLSALAKMAREVLEEE